MSRNAWTIKTKVLDVWTATDTLYRPNDNLSLATQSTQKTVLLANGSKGYFTMETKYLGDQLKFKWYFMDNAFVTKIKTYLTSQTDIQIVDHNLDTYTGRFVSVDADWMKGISDSTSYNVTAGFELMPGLE